MKIRTDFVTNSSSSSFITLTVETVSGKKLTVQNNSEGNLVPERFEMRKKEFSTIESGEQLLDAVIGWLGWVVCDANFDIDENDLEGNVEDIKNLNVEEIAKASFHSSVIGPDYIVESDVSYDWRTDDYTKEYNDSIADEEGEDEYDEEYDDEYDEDYDEEDGE